MPEDDELIDAVAVLGPAPTEEIADFVGCTPRAAGFRLRKLYAEGKVDSERVGTTLVWRPVREITDAVNSRF